MLRVLMATSVYLIAPAAARASGVRERSTGSSAASREAVSLDGRRAAKLAVRAAGGTGNELAAPSRGKRESRAWFARNRLKTGVCSDQSRKEFHMLSGVIVLAVETGVVVIAVAVAVVLVVVLITASVRGQQRRGATRRGEVRHDLDEAEERVERAEHERDVALEDRDSRPEAR